MTGLRCFLFGHDPVVMESTEDLFSIRTQYVECLTCGDSWMAEWDEPIMGDTDDE